MKSISWLPARTENGIYFRGSFQHFCNCRYWKMYNQYFYRNKMNKQIFDMQPFCPLHLANIRKQNLRTVNPPYNFGGSSAHTLPVDSVTGKYICPGRFIWYISPISLSFGIQYYQETLLLISLENVPICKKSLGISSLMPDITCTVAAILNLFF